MIGRLPNQSVERMRRSDRLRPAVSGCRPVILLATVSGFRRRIAHLFRSAQVTAGFEQKETKRTKRRRIGSSFPSLPSVSSRPRCTDGVDFLSCVSRLSRLRSRRGAITSSGRESGDF
jgi:hypothetical protein